jgi:hypothetical protein
MVMGKFRTLLLGMNTTLLFLGTFFLAHPCSSFGLTLITSEEAAQPDGPVATPRGIETLTVKGAGPEIRIFSPKQDEPIRAPVKLDVAFETSPDKAIDYETFTVKYLKLISIDLTGRLKPYLRNDRLVVTDVNVPQGRHRLQLSIAYVSGEKTTMDIILRIDP